MLKLMIVDDEAPIRRWFAACAHKCTGYKLVAEAANGEEALERFHDYHPDVIITDIAMPVMDGLELMKRIKQDDPDIAVVILTCHEEFQFARIALQHGAMEYVLKTELREQDFIDLLERLRQQLTHRRLEQKVIRFATMKETMLEARGYLKDLLLQGKHVEGRIVKAQLNGLGIEIEGNNLFTLAIRTPHIHRTSEQLIRVYSEIETITHYHLLEWEDDMLLTIGNLSGAPSLMLQFTQLQQLLQAVYEATGASVGSSPVHHDVAALSDAMREAIHVLDRLFYQKRSGYGMSNPGVALRKAKPHADPYYILMIKSLEDRRWLDAYDSARLCLTSYAEAQQPDVFLVRAACTQILQAFIHKKLSRSDDNQAYEELVLLPLRRFRCYPELHEYMIKQLDLLLQQLQKTTQSYSPAICNAIQFIESHYSEPISLGDVAAAVHMNREYFSRLFKDETTENFSHYLTHYRMKKAEELLKDKGNKLYSVAEQVGYPNVNYFTRIYKKYKEKHN